MRTTIPSFPLGPEIVNWWPVLSPVPEQRLSYPLQVLYLFGAGMLMMVLGIVFTFSPIVFYDPYAAGNCRRTRW